jgi:hypothetical protein
MSANPNKKAHWALVVSIVVPMLALLVALIDVLFGSSLIPRLLASFHARTVHETQMLAYLRQAAVYLDGLPLYIAETWAWGPSVPNYRVRAGFQQQYAAVAQEMPAVKAAVDEAFQLYGTHTHTQGVPYYAKEEALWRLDQITRRFWEATQDGVKAAWPWQWRSTMQDLRQLKVPDAVREYLLNLKRTRPSS